MAKGKATEYGDYAFPGWADGLGLLISFISVLFIPGLAAYQVMFDWRNKARLPFLIILSISCDNVPDHSCSILLDNSRGGSSPHSSSKIDYAVSGLGTRERCWPCSMESHHAETSKRTATVAHASHRHCHFHHPNATGLFTIDSIKSFADGGTHILKAFGIINLISCSFLIYTLFSCLMGWLVSQRVLGDKLPEELILWASNLYWSI